MHTRNPLKVFVVKPADAGKTLEKYLVEHLATSRKRVKALLDSRSVLVNSRRLWMARHTLSLGDRVETPAPVARNVSRAKPLKILYEDAAVLVVDKPAGMLSNGSDSIEDRLIAEQGNPALRVCHRLDRDTSGCLLVAKSEDVFDAIVRQFRVHEVHKRYHVLVHGLLEPSELTVKKTIDGRRALTHVRVLDANRQASHLLASILTGRTHQIRKHLASIGHPVMGDRHYGPARIKSELVRGFRRQMLVASDLAFETPDGHRPVRVSAPMPRDFRIALGGLNLS